MLVALANNVQRDESFFAAHGWFTMIAICGLASQIPMWKPPTGEPWRQNRTHGKKP
ncbi:MAG: hypothetical protein ACXW6K_22250 [Candidatus Binatia bacterium]